MSDQLWQCTEHIDLNDAVEAAAEVDTVPGTKFSTAAVWSRLLDLLVESTVDQRLEIRHGE